MSTLTRSPQWKALESHAEEMKKTHMRELFADPSRFERFSIDNRDLGILLDFSKNIATTHTLSLLRELAESRGVGEQTARMFAGQRINWTEDRAVLHVALRNRSNTPIELDGRDVMPDINRVLQKMKQFSGAVRDGAWTGATGRAISDVVNIGIGGSAQVA